MKKIEREIKVDYTLDWECGIKIEDLKKDIENIEKLGVTHVCIYYEHDPDPDSCYIEVQPICRRIETNEEFEKRKKEIKKQQEKTKQRELKLLEELKLKYEQ